MQHRRLGRAFIGLLILLANAAWSDSKILATSGGQQFEGQAGGGIVPWAVLSGYGDVGEWGGSVAATQVRVDDFDLRVIGASASFGNRVEISAARQKLEVQPLSLTIEQLIIGTKLRLAGDLVYGPLPAITAGVLWKDNKDSAVPFALGAEEDTGSEFTLSAAKLWLGGLAGRNVFANLTLRNTDANQTGFLGFGGPNGSRQWLAEGSLGVFLSRHWVAGLEYRDKPNNLTAVQEDAWWDAFVGWFPNKRVSVIGAYTDLGDIAGLPDQTGFYLSLQLTQ